MSIDDDFQDSLALVSRRRVVRIAHRATGRICLEYDVTHLTPAELGKWVKSVSHYWDSVAYKIEFPDDFEENGL